MTNEEYAALGKNCRNAEDGNLLIGSFAAELIGESYPFSKAMWEVVFEGYTDAKLGQKFVEWMK